MISSHHRRSTAMRMLRQGQITVTEAAQIAIVSRQRVRIWCQKAGIDPAEARKAWMAVILQRMDKRDKR